QSAQQQGIACARQTFQGAAENLAAEAGEQGLVDHLHARQQGSQLRHGGAQSLGILGGNHRRNFQNSGGADQQLRVPHQLLLLIDRRQQFLLNVDDQQGALFGLERTPCNFRVFSRSGNNSGGHRFLSRSE